MIRKIQIKRHLSLAAKIVKLFQSKFQEEIFYCCFFLNFWKEKSNNSTKVLTTILTVIEERNILRNTFFKATQAFLKTFAPLDFCFFYCSILNAYQRDPPTKFLS